MRPGGHRVSILPLLALAAGFCHAQSTQITGTVRDPSGAVIPGAEVVATNTDTGVEYRTASNQEGYYTVPSLPPGQYRIEVTGTGFKPVVRSGVRLAVAQVLRLDFALEVGALTEAIEVTGEGPLVRSETSSLGQVINNRSIVEMPLNGRGAWDLAQLAPAVVMVTDGSYVSMSGSRTNAQAYLVDGANIVQGSQSRSLPEFSPMVDAIEEFKVLTSNYSAEHGRAAGGVFTAVTKSGTNQFRGTLFEFVRNDAFDARGFFARTKPPLRRNEFGGALGGPIVRNRTHFFVALQATRNHRSQSQFYTLPSEAQRRGDFSRLADAQGRTVPLYNPFTTRPDPTNATRRIRDPFPGNVLPASLLEPAAVRAASYYPAPNLPGNLAGANNFLFNLPIHSRGYNGTLRFDHVLTSRDKLFARYINDYSFQPQSNAFLEAAAYGLGGGNTRSIENKVHSGVLAWTRTFSPSLVSELRYGVSRQDRLITHASVGGDWPSKLGLKGVGPLAFPAFRPQNYAALGVAQPFRDKSNPFSELSGTMSYFRGKHALKTGADYRPSRQYDQFPFAPSGDFSFNRQGTGLQSNVNSGDGFATMLLGFATQAQLRDAIPIRNDIKYLSWFVQDDWKVSPRLTLNLGLRHEVETPPLSPDDSWSSFAMERIHPVAGLPGVVRFAGVDGEPRRIHATDLNNFGPRFGFAWRPLNDNSTVLRGGFGLFFGQPNDFGWEVTTGNHLGFWVETLYVSPDQNQTPALLLKNGYPPYKFPGPEVRNDSFGVGGPAAFSDRDRQTSYSQQFNFGIEREMHGILFEAQYIGNLGRKLNSPSISINQVRPELVGKPGTIQSRRPFPHFSDVTLVFPNWGMSSYHAFSFRSEKRYQGGFQFLFNYTFSKLIDNVDAVVTDFGGTPGSGYQDFYNRRLDKAISPLDITHNAAFNAIWDLPAGVGRRWLRSGTLAHIAGGWQISALGLVRSGPVYGVVTNTNTCECASAGGQRPNILRDPALAADQRSPQRWFDTGAFATPERFTFGNAARSVGRSPGFVNLDLGIMKNFPVAERYRLQFRAEMFNAPNRTNFGNPGTSLGAPTFGQISSAASARVMQFGLKLYF